MTGSPLAFSHPPAGDHFCEAKVLHQKQSHPLGVALFLVPRRGFTPQGGINFDSPEARQQKRKIPKGVFLFWCLVGDSNPGHPA